MWTTLVGASGCPTGLSDDDRESNSCFDGFLGSPPDPRNPYAFPHSVLIFLDVGDRSDTLEACFYRDLARPEERAAVTWLSLDPSIATVEPARGPTTVVTGHRFGRTTVVAVITGIRDEVPVSVCNRLGDCPF